MRIRTPLLSLTLLVVACGGGHRGAASLPAVPVEGSAREVRFLAGNWAGEFVSNRGDRRGEIVFSFPGGRDTAYGHVAFTGPVAPEGCTDAVSHATVPRGPTRIVLTFARVNVGGTSVGGSLRSYPDPELGCPVDTWFEGTIRGDTLRGMYFSHPADRAAAVRLGTWWAARLR